MSEKSFPPGWSMRQDWDPQDHLMKIKGKEYLTVQNRLIWFIRDQRALIEAGLATCAYALETTLVEHDTGKGWAHFKTTVRDVLGNSATMYGSETQRDFPDYIEKASTKSLGRALLLLGYGTAFTADDLDEGERVVDAPVAATTSAPRPAAAPAAPVLPAVATPHQAARPSTVEKGVAPMVAITTWLTARGMIAADLTVYKNRHALIMSKAEDQQTVLRALDDAEGQAEFRAISFARKKLTDIDVIAQIMREEQIGTFVEFWRQYDANQHDWDIFLTNYLQGMKTA